MRKMDCEANENGPFWESHYRPEPNMMGFMKGIGSMMSKFMHWMPYDVEYAKNEIIINMPLPGYDKEEIKVSVKKNIVMIEARHEDGRGSEEPDMKRNLDIQGNPGKFFWERPISVQCPLNQDIDADTVKAKLEKGILTIRLKNEEAHSVEVDGE